MKDTLYTNDKRIDNKNARAMISLIEAQGGKCPDIVVSIKKQLKTKRTVSDKQFKILKSNLSE